MGLRRLFAFPPLFSDQLVKNDAAAGGAPAPVTHDPVLDVKGAAAYCGVSPATMNRKRLDGTGARFVRLSSNRVGYRLSALNAWLAGLEVSSTSDPGAAA